MTQLATTTAPAAEMFAAPRLVMPRADAMKFIQTQLDAGEEVRGQRIKSAAALEKAREMKATWCTKTVDLLNQMFSNNSVAEEWMSWVGKILPEYADLGDFVDQYYEEMEHHLKRLRAISKGIEKMEQSEAAPAAVAAPQQPVTATAEKVIEAPAAEIAPRSATPAPAQAKAQTPKPAQAKQSAAQAQHTQSPKESTVSKGMLIVQGDINGTNTKLNQFAEPMGISLVSANTTGEDKKGAITALDAHKDAAFALVVMGNEPSQANGDTTASITFELGYCVGRLGVAKVAVLHPQGGEVSTDRYGVLHLPLDNSGGWQLHLARHLKRGGLNLDLNKLC